MCNPKVFGGLAAALATAASVHGQGVTLYVDDDAPPAGTGMSWDSAIARLDIALALAAAWRQPDTVIKIAQGVYTPVGQQSSFLVTSGITLIGGFAGRNAMDPGERDPARFVSVLSGDVSRDDTPNFGNRADNCWHVITTEDICSIDGFTIRGGHAAGPAALSADCGAACLLAGTGTAFRNCTITDNFAASSGAVAWGLFSGATFVYSRIIGNHVVDTDPGARGAVISNWDVALLACTLEDNRSPGPLVDIRQDALVANSLIAGNHSTNSASVLAAGNASAVLLSNTIAHNRGRFGAFELIGTSRLTVVGTIFSNNQSDQAAPERLFGQVSSASTIDLSTCLLADPARALAIVGRIVTAADILDTDPLFVDLDGTDNDPATVLDNNYALRPGSPAIDSANSPYETFGLDAAGNPRLADDPGTPDRFQSSAVSLMDLGAFEFRGTSCRADWDISGQVRPEDVPAFIDSWLVRDPRADFNRLDGPSLQDLFDFLTAYFTGC